jgi:adenylate cyclase, class 2
MASVRQYRKFGNGYGKRKIMAIEIEKKYRITAEQLSEVLSALKDFSAEFVREDFEENILYKGGILDTKPCVFRLRKLGKNATLTYKEPIQSEFAVKQRLEYETEISDAEAIEKIIEGLGLKPILVYEKRRKTWNFRSVEIVLDELPFGLFMEIEGSITSIAEAEMILEIEHFEAENESYPSLTMKLGNQVGNVYESRFLK